MTATEYSPEIVAKADAMLLPVDGELAQMPEAEAQRWREILCRHLSEENAVEAQQTILRIRSSLKARKAAEDAARAQAESARVEAMKKSLLSDPFMVQFLHALAVELLHVDTVPATVRDAADELPRLFRKLRP